MKTLLIKAVFISIITLGLNGCYTIIWSPDMEFPTEENYGSTVYYGDSYYGDYYYYYDYPWWLDIVPPAVTQTAGSRDENNNIQNIRNTDGRGTPTRIPELRPPSHNAPPTTTNADGNRNNSGSSSTETTVRNSSSGSGSNSGRESTSGNSNNVRNNNGGRSSGGRK
jgi:uncharacterized membrane protein YgcG